MIPLGVLASRRESSPTLEFIGASASGFPTHVAGDLLIATAFGWWNSPSQEWSTAFLDEEMGLGVYYRFAPGPGTSSPGLSANLGSGYFVYRGANATTPIGAAAGAYDVFPALTLQGSGGSSWVLCGGSSFTGFPATVSGMVPRLADTYSSMFDTNGGVSSFTEKDIGIFAGCSVEIRSG